MLEVIFSRCGRDYDAEFRGHAGKAENGDDVCAMASTLFYTVERALSENGIRVDFCDQPDERCGISHPFLYIHEQGVIKDMTAEIILSVLESGLRMLSESYPENITVRWEGIL